MMYQLSDFMADFYVEAATPGTEMIHVEGDMAAIVWSGQMDAAKKDFAALFYKSIEGKWLLFRGVLARDSDGLPLTDIFEDLVTLVQNHVLEVSHAPSN